MLIVLVLMEIVFVFGVVEIGGRFVFVSVGVVFGVLLCGIVWIICDGGSGVLFFRCCYIRFNVCML